MSQLKGRYLRNRFKVEYKSGIELGASLEQIANVSSLLTLLNYHTLYWSVYNDWLSETSL